MDKKGTDMYCANCGKKTSKEIEFCGNCGYHLNKKDEIVNDEDLKNNVINNEKNKKNKSSQGIGGCLITGIAILVGRSLGYYLGWIGVVLLLSPIFGYYFANWYSNKTEKSNILIKIIAWSNILTWLVPLAGLFTSAASIKFNTKFGRMSKSYLILGVIGLILSIINYIAGIIIILNQSGYTF